MQFGRMEQFKMWWIGRMIFLAQLNYLVVWGTIRFNRAGVVGVPTTWMQLAMVGSLVFVTVFLAIDSWLESAGGREGSEPVTLIEIIGVALWPRTNWSHSRRKHHSVNRPKTLNRLVLAVYGGWLVVALAANTIYMLVLSR